MPPKMFRECWSRIETETGTMRFDWDDSTLRRADGMLRTGNVAKFGMEAFHEAMREVGYDHWQRKHPNYCDDRTICDGSCGNDPEECDGCHQQFFETAKEFLDFIGRTIELLGNDNFGHHDSGCPNAIYDAMYG
jgi:hypothetical protein